MWLIRITGKYTCETMYPNHFLHQSGYILGTHDFVFYYYFTNIGGVFLIYLHWKHGLSYTFEIQWMLDSLTGGIFRGLCRAVSPLWEKHTAAPWWRMLKNEEYWLLSQLIYYKLIYYKIYVNRILHVYAHNYVWNMCNLAQNRK